jgi:phosphonatase-like hydrolase
MNKLVVFDIAGTTIEDNDAVGQAFLKAFLSFGLNPTTEQINNVMGLSKPQSIKIILKELDNTTPIAEIHDQFLKNMIEHYSLDENIKEIPGAAETFNTLHEMDYYVALDTGFSRDITNIILDKLGWVNQGLVDAVVSSDQVKYGRPYPYMIFKLMETLHIKSVHDVVKVGDTVADIYEGLNAGCDVVIGVTTGTETKQSFKEKLSGCHYCVMDDITEVPACLHYTPI